MCSCGGYARRARAPGAPALLALAPLAPVRAEAPPPHPWHVLLMQLCGQMLPPPHSLHLLLILRLGCAPSSARRLPFPRRPRSASACQRRPQNQATPRTRAISLYWHRPCQRRSCCFYPLRPGFLRSGARLLERGPPLLVSLLRLLFLAPSPLVLPCLVLPLSSPLSRLRVATRLRVSRGVESFECRVRCPLRSSQPCTAAS